MNTSLCLVSSALLGLALTVSPLRAQVVNDGATRTLANVTNNIPGDVTVGTNGSFTLLELSDNALLINSLRGVIGRNITARSNEVRLTSPTARWQPGATLYVGSNGPFNRLVVSNGAQVIGTFQGETGIIGRSTNSDGNLALVTGAGSVWSNAGPLTVGSFGDNNQLVVSNGGHVHTVNLCTVGLGGSSASNRVTVSGAGSLWSAGGIHLGLNGVGNRLLVRDGGGVLDTDGFVGSGAGGFNFVDLTGAGTFWTNTGEFHFGDSSQINQMTVSNGAVVFAGRLGSIGRASGASLNTVMVSDPGSMWVNGGELYVGRDGASNRLLVNNGGAVTASNLFIGVQPSSTDNRVIVDGGTLRVTNAAGPGVLDVRRGAVSLRAGAVEADRLVITNVAGAFDLAGGTLITRGAAISNIGGFTVSGSATSPAIWDVRAGIGVHALAVSLSVGGSLPFNQMLITNGGTLTSGDTYIGSNPGSSSNVALLSGAGSKWTAANLDVGNGGAFNRLIVSNGATVEAFNGALGQNSGSSNNLAVVTGAGSLWSNRNEMYVGYQGGGNQLVISNGGTVFAQATRFLGHNSGAISNNTAIVTGPGSRWVGPGNVEVGGPAAFCRLLVTDGGRVENGSGFIGSGSTASNNFAVVTGTGSVWSNLAALRVGPSGPFNVLVVSNGATVVAPNGVVGENASHNTAVVTGAGSVWRNGNVDVGFFGNSNRVAVQNGGLLVSDFGSLGGGGGFSNAVIVTGSGSVWNNRSDLTLGGFGRGNQLLVSNGGLAVSSNSFVGYADSASNNFVLVSGSGSVWSNRNELTLGSNSPGNRIEVRDGARVFVKGSTFMGRSGLSRSNSILVTGAGTVWTNAGGSSFFVGFPGSELVVSNGARMHASSWDLGGFNSGNCQAVITGAGTLLDCVTAAIDLRSGDRMSISDGATFLAGSAYADNRSLNNEILVTGSGSSWRSDLLVLGTISPGVRLVLTNGGEFRSPLTGGLSGQQGIIVGESAISTNHRVVVDGGTIRAANTNRNSTLDVRRGTNVFNAGLIDVDVLLLTNTLGRFEFNGGTLITRGAVISNGAPFIVGGPGGVPAVWDVRASPIIHANAGFSIVIGNASPLNRLLMTNGAVLSGGDNIIGSSAGGVSNSAVIAGTGSRWQMGDFAVGFSGSLNSLAISNGGKLAASGFVHLSENAESSNNLALVSGVGSELSVTNDNLAVGYLGAGNRLVVENGGVARDESGSLGFGGSSSNNLALVTGSGSLWTNEQSLLVGISGAGNQLVVSNGGLVTSFDDVIGVDSSSSNNLAVVTGAGSLWNNRRELAVGLNSPSNQLVVSNGGTVFGIANRYVGQNDGALANSAIITDPGSAWLGDDSLYVGAAGSFNRLFVRDGGRVTSGIATLGGLASADGNQALVTDAGSSWTNQLDLNVGEGGSGNRLTISNAATLASFSSAFIGRLTTAASNSVTVTDPGSRWLIASNLFVGSNGPFNHLVIANGGRVQSRFATLGVSLSSSNNFVLVTGSGSVWSNASSFDVGLSGRASQLVVSNGGLLQSSSVFLGQNASSSNNEVRITGAGSFWRALGSLFVGTSGNANRLVITNGGRMFNGSASIGSGSENNEVLVTGPGSTWTNGASMHVGASGGGNRLVINNGGVVHEPFDIRMGENPSSTNNRIVVDGGTLVMADPTFGAFDVRRGTNVLNAGLISVGQVLRVTNVLGVFEFNGGKLIARGSAVSNGRLFTVGDGSSAATFELRGGTHSFSNDLTVANNAALTGNGNVTGVLTVRPGGALAPGDSVGTIILSNSPVLQGVVIMEISKDGEGLINDEIQIAGALTYGGSLIVSNRGPDALIAGDRFRLFTANAYSGSFSNLTLPPLGAGLAWRTNLLVDGSIEVASLAPPGFSSVSLAGTNLVLAGTNGPANGSYTVLASTNVALPLSSWASLLTNQFDAAGAFSFTNAIVPQIPQRFFRLRTP